MGGRCRRQDEVDLQAAPGREIPRRLRLHGRCRGLERREGSEEGGAAVRARPDRRHRQPHADARVGPQGRRLHRRDDDEGARQLPADQPDQPVHGVAGPLAEKVRCPGKRRRPCRARQAGLDAILC